MYFHCAGCARLCPGLRSLGSGWLWDKCSPRLLGSREPSTFRSSRVLPATFGVYLSAKLDYIDEDLYVTRHAVSGTKMNGIIRWDFLIYTIKIHATYKKIVCCIRIFHWDFCASNNGAYNNINKKYRVKHALSRNHGMLFFSKKKWRYFNWNSLNSFSRRWLLKSSVLSLKSIKKEHASLGACISSHLNAQRILFSVVLAFYRAKPFKLKVSVVYQDRHGRHSRTIWWQHWSCNMMERKFCKSQKYKHIN